MTNIYAALEIGTTRTVLAIAESESGGKLKVTAHAEIPSRGVRKSQILDMNMATQSIRGVLHDIEKKQKAHGSSITIGNAVLVISGQHVTVTPQVSTVSVSGGRVSTDDVRSVIEDARSRDLPKDRELLDIVEQDYGLDSLGGILTPKGMSGGVLKLNTLHVHADRNRIADARSAAEAAHLEIREPLLAVTSAADAVLTDQERKNGVLVLDFGGGSTGYAVYYDGFLVTTGVIGVGGDHVSSDIAHAFQTTHSQAEELKIAEASAVLGPSDAGDERVRIPGSSTLMESRTVSRRALDTVVNARMRELLAMIRERLEEGDLLARLHTGTVVTGGASALKDLDALIQRELGTTVRPGRPAHLDGLDDTDYPPSYAAIAGALIYAHRNFEEKPLLNTLFGSLFK